MICLERFSDPQVLSCEHTFCKQCVTRLTRADVIRCPKCRQTTRRRDVRPDARLATFQDALARRAEELIHDAEQRAAAHDVTIRVVDSTGLSYDETFSIDIQNQTGLSDQPNYVQAMIPGSGGQAARFWPNVDSSTPTQITYALLTATSVIISLILGWQFLVVILVYMVLSLAYSLRWKRMRWIDIATLASLYTVRVVAGAAAGSVFVSGFMLVFIFPIFITLGCVKRLTELTLAVSNERLPGRGYSRSDRGDLLNMAWLGGIGALVTFFLYTLSDQARTLYPIQWVLWLAMVPIALWLLRMIRLGYFGKQDYDPIVFALRDKRGVGLLLIILSLMFYAAGLWQDWFGFELSVR